MTEEAIFSENVGRVVSIARRLSRAYGLDYDQTFSDASLGLLKAIRAFDPSRGVPFGAYASYRITGEVIDGIRSNRAAFAEVELGDIDMAIPAGEPDVISDVRSAVERLPQRQRLVVELYYFAGHGQSEIADMLGLHPSRVSQILASAAVRLRDALGSYRPHAKVTTFVGGCDCPDCHAFRRVSAAA